MSFRCQKCNEVQVDGTKETKVVTEVRKVIYPTVKDSYGKYRTPEGFETVKELTVCPECATHKFTTTIVDLKVIEGEVE
ncbi:MAG: hypothetical protein PHT02_00610 [Tissierellia bacterium]|nr:hypothetical protein [Tissierellia bacterium]